MKKPVILCVDDQETILESLKIELKTALDENYIIETAESGEDALDLLSELLEDEIEVPLVICDYVMPGMKGDELLKCIHEIAPKTLKIMLTGQADINGISNAINNAKLYRYIAKPWQYEDLKLTVKEALNSYSLEKELAQKNAKLQQLNQELENLVEQRTAQLRKSEEKFAKAFRASPNPMTITRLSDGCHLEVNEAFCKAIGYSVEKVLGKTAVELGIWSNLNTRDRLFNLLKEQGTVRNYEVEFCNQSGEIRTALLAAEIIEIDGQTCLISVSQDISDRKQAELALQQAKEAADKANRAKSEFLANMSHELRTPLNAILGFSQLLVRDPSMNPEQQEHLGIISRSGEHLLNLINNILQMSKIEVGRITLEPHVFDLHSLLDTLEEMLLLQVEKKGLQLIFDRAPNLPQFVKTDESKLRQVLLNLLSNAIKFTNEGGVTLRIKSDGSSVLGEGQQQSPLPIPHHKLLFEVEDTGAGIALEEMDNLFKPFAQTETGRRSLEGTGLGLPISQQFIQLMGGDISVNSTIGQGSIFKFDVAVELADTNEIQATQATRRVIGLETGQPEYRILVVDDRLESRLFLSKLLTSIGFSVREAENGLQAVELWSNWEPHLIWMDMRMPVMDGYEATKRIKAHLKGHATVIIALTASAFDEERSVILSIGCDDFVAKPFREQVILDKIAHYLGVRYVYDQEFLLTAGSGGVRISGACVNSDTYILTPQCFQDLPLEWVNDLYEAASSIENEQILQMVSELPASHAAFGDAIAKLVDNFRCDQIIDLIEEFQSS